MSDLAAVGARLVILAIVAASVTWIIIWIAERYEEYECRRKNRMRGKK